MSNPRGSGSDPYNTAAPRGFVRMYIDLEPELSDYLSERVKLVGSSKRAYIRALIIKDQQETSKHGKTSRK